jgi:tetratricopeptide (TPR) repeat protein
MTARFALLPPPASHSQGKRTCTHAHLYATESLLWPKSHVLLQVHVRTAQASTQSDLDAILAWIGDAHADVDKAVIAALREWLAVTAQAALDAMAEEERATSTLINNLGMLFQDQGKYTEAEKLFTEALAARRRQLGDDHPSTLGSMNNLCVLYKQQGKYTEAEELLKERLAARRRQLGDDHPSTRISMNNLGRLYQDQRKYAEAEELLTEALTAQRRQLGDDHPHTLNAEGNLGVVRIRQGGAAHAEGAAAVASVLVRLQAPPHSLAETHAWVVKFCKALAF